MARLFDNGSTQCLRNSSTPVTGVPLTLAAWFNTDDLGVNQCLLSVADSGSGNNYFTILIEGLVDDYLDASQRSASTTGHCRTTAAPSADAWHHGCAVFAAIDDTRSYLDGGGKGTDNTSITPTGLDRVGIGVHADSTPLGYMPGAIAEAAIWNAALTDDEVAILAKGYSPLLVRPQNLVAYWPLIRDTDDDIVGGYSMTPVNSPTVAAHPRVFYPGMPHYPYAAAAIAALRIPRHPAAYFGGPTIF